MISLNFKTLAQTPFFSLSVSWSGFGWVLLVCSYSAPYITKLKLSICVFKHLKDSGMCVCVCVCVCVCESLICVWLCNVMDCRLLCPWNSPGKNTRVGNHSLLQGIFLTQESNLGFLHCRQILHHLRHKGSPGTWWILINIYWTNSSVSSDSSSLGTDFLFCF